MRGVSPGGARRGDRDASEDSGRPLRDVLVDDGIVTEVELAEALAQAYGLQDRRSRRLPDRRRGHRRDPVRAGPPAPGARHRHRRRRDRRRRRRPRRRAGPRRRPGRHRAVGPRRSSSPATSCSRRSSGSSAPRTTSTTSPPAWAPTPRPSLMNAIESVGEEAPIVRYVNALIEQAIENRASDLHLEPTEHDLRVRFRIDGVLHEIDTVPRSDPVGADQPVEDHVRRRHHRAAGPAERPHHRRPEPPARSTCAWPRCPPCGARRSCCASSTPAASTSSSNAWASPTHNYERFSAFVHQTARHAAGHRPDRLGQVDHAVRDADRDQQARGQHHHRRGPGRVPAARRQPGAGQPQGRADLRRRAAGDPALGPRRRAHRRDPRPGHRAAGRSRRR